MSCLIKGLLFAGGLAVGYYSGGKLVDNNTSTENYKIVEKDDGHYLRSKELGKSYILQEVNDEVYMGDLEHLANGVKALASDNVNRYDMRKGGLYE